MTTPPLLPGVSDSTLGGRLTRYARVSTAVGGVAARWAGERYLGLRFAEGEAPAALREALGGLKGPLMKVAQMLATVPDLLPAAYTDELRQLQANAPPMGWPFVRRRMVAELGADWLTRFRDFGREAARAASLGQVHRAVGLDGRALACKLQYPDMASAVDADLRQLRLIFSLFERYDNVIQTDRIHEELSARLNEELDYQREARHLGLFRDLLAKTPEVHVPEVVDALSTRRLLTMEWLEGEPLLPYAKCHPEAAAALAMTMFHAWYVPFYHYGIIHGDPHLGNYTVRADGSINLLDFGCVRIFRPDFVLGVIELYHALLTDDTDRAVAAYRLWGFVDPSRELIDILNVWARFVYGPLLDDRCHRIETAASSTQGRRAAETVHAALRRLGGVVVPREFVFMDRAALGLGSVFVHLGADINWYRLFQGLIEAFDVDALAARQAGMLARYGLQPA